MNANRTALFYLLMTAACLQAQPQTNQHGLRVATATARLLDDKGTCNDTRRVSVRRPDGSIVPADLASLYPATTPYLEFENWVEQLGEDYAESITGGCRGTRQGANQATFERFVRDNFRKVYAHYTLIVEVLPKSGTYRVTFAPSSEPAPPDIRNQSDWKIVTLSQHPVPQVMEQQDELAVTLTTYAAGVKLVDYIHLGSLDKMPKRSDAARDFYAEDAEFTLGRPRLRVNGEQRNAVIFPELLRGRVIWLYVPGLGRYIATYSPHPEAGFEKAGELTGGSMTLTVGGNVLRIASHERIAPGGGVYNVYGKLDAKWMPADPKDRDKFMAGVSPAVETALGH